ncbi:MAG TPA: HAD family hydrolase [Candidatus Dormibacteraeota bacterium]|nr:HAD family hydrolase [Candidatus Dormibacteraeota bacterium]
MRWVFFDVGGTLVDDRAYVTYLANVVRHELAGAGMVTKTDEFAAVRRRLLKENPPSLARALIDHYLPDDPERAASVAGRVFQPRLEHGATQSRLLPGAFEALEALSGRYRLGVIANYDSFIRDVLRDAHALRFFSDLVISSEVGLVKPAPGIFEVALRRAGIRPEEGVMVGDRPDNDVVTPKAMGMRTVRVLRPYRSRTVPGSEVHAVDPDVTVASVAEVPAAVAMLDSQ